MRIHGLLIGVVICAWASALAAQPAGDSLEVSPFAGYLFGGTVYDFNNSPPGFPPSSFRATLGDHASYGLRVGYLFGNRLEPEFEWSRSEPRLQFRIPSHPADLPVTMDFFLAGVTYHFASTRVRPYISLEAGVARLSGADDVQARFTGKLALGLKAFVTAWLGLRMEAGGYATRIGEAPFGVPCTTFPLGEPDLIPVGCANRDWLFNGNLTGGLVFAF